MNFFQLLFQLGSRIRNPNLLSSFEFLKRSEQWSAEKLKKYQLVRCRSLLNFADQHSRFYQSRFNSSGFKLTNFQKFGDLQEIQPVSKGELISRKSEFDTTGSFKFKKLFNAESSGSTGQPLQFLKNEEWDSWNRATIQRGYSWYGVETWERNGYFWGYNPDPSKVRKTRIMDTFQNRFRVFSYNDNDLKIFIQKLQKAKYLHGYSSMIYEIARIINKNRIETSSLNLKMIKGTSEKIHQHYHNEVIQAFGQKIISEYGAAEAGIVAFECPFGSMHLNMEGCIVEDDNGEILVTNLNSYSFPIIRYRLGDSIQLEDEKFKCKCGMEHRVLREITGRVGKRIFGKSITYPSLTVYNIFKNLYLDAGLAINGQFVQKIKGHLLVKVEQALTSEEKALINQEMNSYFKHDMDWQIEENSKIHTRDSKRTDFLSYIE